MLFLREVANSGLRTMSSTSRSLCGVVFDMDGTLTVPCLDFKKLRQQLGIIDNRDILSHVGSLTETKKKEAMEIIESFEKEGRENLQIQPGIKELFHFLSEKSGLNLGLLTRNNGEAVEHFISKCVENGICESSENLFSIVLTRDFTPVKPDPAPLFHIANTWKIEPSKLLMVGDDKHDIECGIAAGAGTILLNNEKNQETKKLAKFSVDKLLDIIPIVREHLET